ncbi:hypothetical protein FB451DRAFT_1552553 [Mycena latifolia]|nr:hypothetical protein FB451DRAFT_1552553 [Mycena latifolia]
MTMGAFNCLRYFGALFLGGPLREADLSRRGPGGARAGRSFTDMSVEVRSSVPDEESDAFEPISMSVLDTVTPAPSAQPATAQFDQTLPVSTTNSRTPHPLAPGVVFGIAMGGAVLLGAVVATLVYVCRASRRPSDPEYRAKYFLPRRKATGVTAFVSGPSDSKRTLVVPPAKEAPPVATTRYEGRSVKVSRPKPVATARRAPPPAEPQGRRLRPANRVGQSPPRRTMLVVNNI